MLRSWLAYLLALTMLLLGSGTLSYLHSREHEREDAQAAGNRSDTPAVPPIPHDADNCAVHAMLAAPMSAASAVPLLVMVQPVWIESPSQPAEVQGQWVWSDISCRGPPVL